MRSLDTRAWMRAQAADLLDSAERLQRQFFQVGPALEVAIGRPAMELPLLEAGDG